MTPDETRRLREQLAGAVPEPPPASGRAAAAARRGRRRRRAVVVASVAACAAATGGIIVPVLAQGPDTTGGSTGPVAADSAADSDSATPPDDAGCRSGDELSTDPPEADAQWIRLCANRSGWVFDAAGAQVPDEVLTDDVDELVAGWLSAETPAPCPDPPAGDRFFFQVGFGDGTVRELTLRLSGCARAVLAGTPLEVTARDVFGAVLARMAAQREAGIEPVVKGAPPPPCPDEPQRLRGEEPPGNSGGWLIPLPPRSTVLCRYSGSFAPNGELEATFEGSTSLSPAQGEQIRIAYHSRSSGMVDCGADLSQPVWAVQMEDVTGTWRTFSVDMSFCGTIVSDFDDYGLAAWWLPEVLQQAWEARQG